MAPRASWKGYLKLSLVSCAVNLYPAASSSSRVSFNTINRKTGHKVKRQFVDAETGEVVENEDQAKGYPVAKDSFLLVDDEELDKIEIESTHTIDIEKFVPRSEVDPRYLEAVHDEPLEVVRFPAQGHQHADCVAQHRRVLDQPRIRLGQMKANPSISPALEPKIRLHEQSLPRRG